MPTSDSADGARTLVLFVCSGNTCRSPMAEAIARVLLAERGTDRVDIASAGTGAATGMPATFEAQQAVAALGGDLSTHRSQPLTEALVADADRIFVMTERHRRAVLTLVADAPVELLDPAGDVTDPIGQSQQVYDQTAALIKDRLEQRLAAAIA